jgi:transglutaminase-like putative cysteine protease
MQTHKMENYLKPTAFLDFDNASVQDFATKHIQDAQTDIEKAKALYLAVRDGFQYNPYHLNLTREGLKASNLLQRNYGYCVEKAILLASTARATGIPSRLFFGNVCNHIATEKLEAALQTNLLVFHGSAELYLNGKWVKATPAFNKSLCTKLNVEPLEFDGTVDSLFQQYNKEGNRFMEYLDEYGSFDDMPFELYLSELHKHYGHLVDEKIDLKEGFVLQLGS